jgi:tripartite-type tricarboxylate transporter receptor subunit TctC
MSRREYRRNVLRILGLAASGSLSSAWARDNDYPNRPLRMLLAFPPGGPSDLTARVIAEKMSATLGQSVVVENMPGAAGLIGTAAVARARNDGYTFGLVSSGPLTLTPQVRKDIPWQSIDDFAPISLAAEVPLVLFVNPQLGVSTVPELIALIRANPGKYSYGSDGVTSATHLAFEYFSQMNGGLAVEHVPYKGTAPLIFDVVSNTIQMAFAGINGPLAQAKLGKLKLLAVTSRTRARAVPDVPTMIEQGYKEFTLSGLFGLFAPRGTPEEIIRILNDHARRALTNQALVDTLQEAGIIAEGSTPEELMKILARYASIYRSIVEKGGIKLD